MEGLRNGTKTEGAPSADFKGGYSFEGNGFDIFKRVFGTENPFGENFLHPDEIRLVEPQGGDELKAITVTLPCTISEFYNGSLKSFHFNR
jgi:DnaJ-class molecular chaperone